MRVQSYDHTAAVCTHMDVCACDLKSEFLFGPVLVKHQPTVSQRTIQKHYWKLLLSNYSLMIISNEFT